MEMKAIIGVAAYMSVIVIGVIMYLVSMKQQQRADRNTRKKVIEKVEAEYAGS